MNKILIGVSFLLGTILVIVNSISVQPMLFISAAGNGTVVFVSIIIGIMGGFGIKGILNERSKENYNDGVNF